MMIPTILTIRSFDILCTSFVLSVNSLHLNLLILPDSVNPQVLNNDRPKFSSQLNFPACLLAHYVSVPLV